MEEGLCLLESFNLLCACTLSHFSRVQLSVTPCTIAHQAPPSMGFSRQKYWSGLPCPPPGDFPDPGIEPLSLTSSALAGGFFTTSATWEDLLDKIRDCKDPSGVTCLRRWFPSVLSFRLYLGHFLLEECGLVLCFLESGLASHCFDK